MNLEDVAVRRKFVSTFGFRVFDGNYQFRKYRQGWTEHATDPAKLQRICLLNSIMNISGWLIFFAKALV
jgi:hypothetical protein